MINWTEEDVKFVCNTMINPAMTQLLKFIETSNDSHNKTVDALTNALREISYMQNREIAFLKTLIIKYCHLDPDKFDIARKEYFKQYDELKKEK